MDLKEQLQVLAIRIKKNRDSITTEEASKTACVLPFIQALGYDVFNPSEVVPEFVADVPGKKGEKVDYAIYKDGKPIILIECKPIGSDLEIKYAPQLYRYFNTCSVRFGLLTDGLRYLFYSDIKESNKMDEIPFFEFNLLTDTEENRSKQIEELKKFTKNAFNLETIIGSATNLKYSKALKSEIGRIFLEVPDDLVKILSKNIHEGRYTQQVLDRFREQTKKALSEYIADRVADRLNTALASNKDETSTEPKTGETMGESENPEIESGIFTTDEELESFRIIQAIASEVTDPDRIFVRDAKTYCAILFEDNNRQPIVRLYYRKTKLSLVIFDVSEGSKFEIGKISQLYKHKSNILTAIKNYLQ